MTRTERAALIERALPAKPGWTIRTLSGRLMAVFPAGRFATPEEAVAFYQRGTVTHPQPVRAFPR